MSKNQEQMFLNISKLVVVLERIAKLVEAEMKKQNNY
tara:strand:- start:335 stop:445 length:111 start_codon:yes stop_codon:yes gene_type:complete